VRKVFGQSAIVFAAVAAIVAAPTAQAQCWTPAQARAAAVRELDTLMMVEALRCRTGDAGFLDSYNAFVVSSRAALTQANGVLRTHYQALGAHAGVDALDRYITRVANRYGAGVAGLGCADVGSIVRAATSEGASPETLADLAARAGITPSLDDAACVVEPLTVAIAAAPSAVPVEKVVLAAAN
jgi:hypothetical protein